jgi:anti-anti-sigma factor
VTVVRRVAAAASPLSVAASASLSVSVEHSPDASRPTAALVGEIDLSNVDALASSLRATVPNTAAGLVLDLTRVTYLDSTGIRLLFELARELADRQQDVQVVSPHASPLRRVLLLAGVPAAMPVVCEHGLTEHVLTEHDGERDR